MKLSVRTDTITSKAGDRFVVSLPDGDESIILNPTASRIWGEIMSTEVVESVELEKLLLSWYPSLSRETAAGDVSKFVERLKAHFLVEEVG